MKRISLSLITLILLVVSSAKALDLFQIDNDKHILFLHAENYKDKNNAHSYLVDYNHAEKTIILSLQTNLFATELPGFEKDFVNFGLGVKIDCSEKKIALAGIGTMWTIYIPNHDYESGLLNFLAYEMASHTSLIFGYGKYPGILQNQFEFLYKGTVGLYMNTFRNYDLDSPEIKLGLVGQRKLSDNHALSACLWTSFTGKSGIRFSYRGFFFQK